MKSCWQKFTIGDLCDNISNTYKNNDSRVILINTSDVFEGNILNHELVENKNVKGQFKKTFKKSDILYSEIRPKNRRFAFVSIEDTSKYIASTKLMILRAKTEYVLPMYLYKILTSSSIINKLQHLAETRSGTFPQITFLSELAPIYVNVPNLETQQRILNFTNPIDEKIELNNKINKNLEQQAQAIFKNMFPSINSGNIEVGKYIIPKRGKNLISKNAIWGVVPVIAGGLQPAAYHNAANTSAPVITIAASGANAGYVKLWNIPVWSSDSSFIDSNMTENIYFWYVMLKLRQKEIFDLQIGSAQPHIYPKHIAQLKLKAFNKENIVTFNQEVKPLFLMIGVKIVENERLADIRDALLPKLMSGEISLERLEMLK